MRITKKNGPAREGAGPARSTARTPLLLQAGLLVLAFLLGVLVSYGEWYRPVTNFLTLFLRRPTLAVDSFLHRSELEGLALDVAFTDYQQLLDRRERALRLGAHLQDEQEGVPATIHHTGRPVDVSLRLLEAPASSFESTAWPFEVTVEGDERLLGLRRFTLIPASEDSLLTWGYLETLRRAGLPAPHLSFVRLSVNGTRRGVYVLQEQPTPGMLADQERPNSVAVTFDSSVYWQAYTRLGEALPGGGFQYARGVPVLADGEEAVSSTHAEGLALLEALREGRVPPSQAFDEQQVATFVAVTALWYGAPELDWRALAFAYDPATMRLEPIGMARPSGPATPLPAALIADAALQREVAGAMVHWSRPTALAELRAGLEPDLESLRLALSSELGDLPSPWPLVESHQARMRRMLDPAFPLVAEIESNGEGLLLRLRNVTPFPLQIIGLDVGEEIVLPVEPGWVVESDRTLLVEDPEEGQGVILPALEGALPAVIQVQVPLEALGVQGEAGEGIFITTRVWGLEGVQRVPVTSRLEGMP